MEIFSHIALTFGLVYGSLDGWHAGRSAALPKVTGYLLIGVVLGPAIDFKADAHVHELNL